MSYILKGAFEQRWQASNWVFHAMSDTLLKAFREMPDAEQLANRLEDAIDMEIGYMNVSDLLALPDQSAVWNAAVDKTISELRQQGNSDWSDPSRFDEFLTEVAKLKSIALTPQPA